jgi:hypothetical protein
LARQRSASLDPFEEDPRSGRIGKPEDSQGTVSKSNEKQENDKLIKKEETLNVSPIKQRLSCLSKHLNICSRPSDQKEKKKLKRLGCIQNSSGSAHMAHPGKGKKKEENFAVVSKGYGLRLQTHTYKYTKHGLGCG